MTLGAKEPSRLDAAVVPFVALGFSIVVALIAPHYASWVSGPIPTITAYYLACYPIWILINLASVIVQKAVKRMQLHTYEGGFWKKLDAVLSALSVLSVLVGVVALVVPALHRM